MASQRPAREPPGTDPSTAELVHRAVTQISALVRDEFALATMELTAKGRRVGLGGGLAGVAAVLARYGIGLVLTLTVVALDLVWPLWLALLVVTVVVFTAAGGAALLGRRHLRAAVRTAVREGRNP